jgi:hypothetical protein
VVERRTRIVEFDADRDGQELDEWLPLRRADVDLALGEVGAVVFRGFDVRTVERFQEARDALLPARASYVEAATPRTRLGDDVYSSTDFSAKETIALHNENSYAERWPGLLLFGCLQPAAGGGATPVADVRGVLERLPDGVVTEFDRRGWMLVRNYGGGFGLPWQRAFGTDDRAEVDRYCAESGIAAEWLPGERLRTRQVRAALAMHPGTSEVVWFNHVCFWHESRLAPAVREMLREEFGHEGMPYGTYFGDGERIPDETVALIAAAYEAEKVARPWAAGELMLLDNMLVAHGREPYRGERRVAVAMGVEQARARCAVPAGWR